MRDRSASPSRNDSGSTRGDREGRGDFSRNDAGRRRDRGGRGGRDFASSRPDRNYDNSIFIGNVPFTATSQDIRDLFRDLYTIVRADIVTNRGQSRGMATVEFGSKDDVRNAIANFDHFELQGREIFVRQDYPPPGDKRRERGSERPERRRDVGRDSAGGSGAPGTEVFVGNLPFSATWQNLKDLMRGAGSVVRADVKTDNWGKSRGFGTVIFATPEEAQAAILQFQGYEMDGRRIDTRLGRGSGGGAGNERQDQQQSYSTSAREPPKTNTAFTEGVTGNGSVSSTIYVANLPFVTSVEDLFELFETIGRVTKAEIQYNNSGRPSGNAVVQFELEDLADLAIKNLDRYNYGGRDLRITYANTPGQSAGGYEDQYGAPSGGNGDYAAEPVFENVADADMAEAQPEPPIGA